MNSRVSMGSAGVKFEIWGGWEGCVACSPQADAAPGMKAGRDLSSPRNFPFLSQYHALPSCSFPWTLDTPQVKTSL